MSSRKKKDRGSLVKCPECADVGSYSNFARHYGRHFRDKPAKRRSSSASATLCRAARIDDGAAMFPIDLESEDDRQSVASFDTMFSAPDCRSEDRPDRRFAGLSLSAYSTALAAARATVAASHTAYDVVHLCDYIERNYPQVPAEARPFLVIGTAAGAQHVANMHFLVETFRASRDPRKREEAESAIWTNASLCFGLKTNPNDVPATVVSTPVEKVPVLQPRTRGRGRSSGSLRDTSQGSTTRTEHLPAIPTDVP